MTQQQQHRRAPEPDAIEILPVEDPRVQQMIAYLKTRTEDDFAEALADVIMEPYSVGVAAFHAPELRRKSLIACKYLADHARAVMRHREPSASNKFLQGATERFLAKVNRERRLIENQITGDLADRGIISQSPSPRARALRRLKQRHVAEFQELFREETEKLKEENRRKKAEARAANRGRR